MPAAKAATAKPAKTAKLKPRMSLAEAMSALEAAGTEQARKTYRRHGAKDPMFGVSFAFMKTLVKKIGVDHELARQLWETGNHDARLLAVKIADPAQATSKELDRWATDMAVTRMCCGYVPMLTAEGPFASAKVDDWLAQGSKRRNSGWSLVGNLAMLDESAPDKVFLDRLAEIERTIHTIPNGERDVMNGALIQIGCRNAALRKAALAAAKRIGKVEVDHGDTECKTPDAAAYIEKCWAHSAAKGFESPAAQERAREPMRTRC
jgi:hypothetical protein